jgi:hypothetical protein
MAVIRHDPRQEIKFSFCPTEKHKGELWAKLQDRDLTESCEIIDIAYRWSHEIPLKWWVKDTFEDFTLFDVEELISKFNKGLTQVPGIVLTLDHTDGNFTTFRTWSIEKDKYYQMLLDDNKKLRITTPLNPRQVV